MPIEDRRSALKEIAQTIDTNAQELGSILTSEQGKPLANALAEAHGFAAFTRYYASLEMPTEVIQDDDQIRVEAHRAPLGVVAAITPWNFPLVLIGFKFGCI